MIEAPLPGTAGFKGVMNGVKHLFFMAAPQRRHQQVFRSVAGDAVNHCFRWENFQTPDDQVGVFVHRKNMKR